MKVKKLTLAGLLIAIGVVCATFSIPIGAAKCFPIQHMVNVIAGVLLGPLYSLSVAFCISLIRVLSGTGTLLAFPGSMLGALCCGLLFKRFHKLPIAYLGELIGTGVLGGLAAFPVATLLLGKEAALFAYVLPFMLSSLVGATISILVLNVLTRTKVWQEWFICSQKS
ncbi:MAG: energy coupling factor transporter S component ThiW [Cellulosilyticaceae bacterium]